MFTECKNRQSQLLYERGGGKETCREERKKHKTTGKYDSEPGRQSVWIALMHFPAEPYSRATSPVGLSFFQWMESIWSSVESTVNVVRETLLRSRHLTTDLTYGILPVIYLQSSDKMKREEKYYFQDTCTCTVWICA